MIAWPAVTTCEMLPGDARLPTCHGGRGEARGLRGNTKRGCGEEFM